MLAATQTRALLPKIGTTQGRVINNLKINVNTYIYTIHADWWGLKNTTHKKLRSSMEMETKHRCRFLNAEY